MKEETYATAPPTRFRTLMQAAIMGNKELGEVLGLFRRAPAGAVGRTLQESAPDGGDKRSDICLHRLTRGGILNFR